MKRPIYSILRINDPAFLPNDRDDRAAQVHSGNLVGIVCAAPVHPELDDSFGTAQILIFSGRVIVKTHYDTYVFVDFN